LIAVIADQPPHKEIHVILDNYSTHKKNDDWPAKFEGRVQFHFTPTSASWLNQIEIVFGLLQRKTLNGASFKTKDQLRDAIEAFIRKHNERAKPFRWREREVKGSPLRFTWRLSIASAGGSQSSGNRLNEARPLLLLVEYLQALPPRCLLPKYRTVRCAISTDVRRRFSTMLKYR
jgi:transposase